MTDLPGAIHLVAETPEADTVGLLATVASAQIAPMRAARMVAIFEQAARRVDAARAEIDGEHQLGPDERAPAGELVGAEGVRVA